MAKYEITRSVKQSFASSSSGQDAGDADKMGVSGAAIWRLALKWL